MFKNLCRITGTLLLLFFVLFSAYGSGKMQVKIAEPVILEIAEDRSPAPVYKWAIKKDNQIIEAREGRQLQYAFTEPGEYAVNLSIISPNQTVETTQILVLVGEEYASQQLPDGDESSADGVYGTGGLIGSDGMATVRVVRKFAIDLKTLPEKAADHSIHLLGEGSVVFDLTGSVGDIIEYRIDRNIFEDSDSNGTANDDIDNADHRSYLTGAPWETFYRSEDVSQVVSEVTLVDKEGRKIKEQAEIVFDQLPARDGDPLAKLQLSPAPDADTGISYLYGEEGTVSFYAKPSVGNILEFRIDRDIFTDSSGDGNPANDVDNLDDPSFKTGDVWQTTYPKTDRQIIAQLIVVGEGGKGSRIQRGIAFTDRPLQAPEPEAPVETIHIEANKSFVLKGDAIEFQVVGLKQALNNYTFSWDLNEDGQYDKEVPGDNTLQHIFEESGTVTVKVHIEDQESNKADRELKLLVKEENKTTAQFDTRTEEGKVFFQNRSTPALNLADKSLTYQWYFGDTDEANFFSQADQEKLENPFYRYARPGKYRVTLRATDVSGVISETSQEIELTEENLKGLPSPSQTAPDSETELEDETVPDANGDLPASSEPQKQPGLLWRIVKIMLYVVLIIILMVILMVLGLLIFTKFKHPDLAFDELIEEAKLKVLSLLGIEEHEVAAVTAESTPPSTSATMDTPVKTARENSVSKQTPVSADEPLEGEVVDSAPAATPTSSSLSAESKAPPATPTPASPSGGDGPVPDWLKNA